MYFYFKISRYILFLFIVEQKVLYKIGREDNYLQKEVICIFCALVSDRSCSKMKIKTEKSYFKKFTFSLLLII